MQLHKNISLKAFNTFGVDIIASEFVAVESIGQLTKVFEEVSNKQLPYLVLGSGSNVLFTKDYPGLIIKNEIGGIELINEDDDHFYVKVGAGVNWHQFVLYCIEHGWGGVENLSLIPGTVGAAPVQNIGAYGVEIKDVIEEIHAWDVKKNESVVLANAECKFDYRNSIFKQVYKGDVIICEVVFKLNKQHIIKVGYGAIQDELKKQNIASPSIRDVSNAVIAIRSSKLPDPNEIGNAGSFFKNPVVSQDFYQHLKKCYPSIVSYPSGSDVKLAAGWLIEQAGWKGYHEGNVGCYQKQALVLVNLGGATGAEILALARQIKESVLKKFDIRLEYEVNVI